MVVETIVFVSDYIIRLRRRIRYSATFFRCGRILYGKGGYAIYKLFILSLTKRKNMLQ